MLILGIVLFILAICTSFLTFMAEYDGLSLRAFQVYLSVMGVNILFIILCFIFCLLAVINDKILIFNEECFDSTTNTFNDSVFDYGLLKVMGIISMVGCGINVIVNGGFLVIFIPMILEGIRKKEKEGNEGMVSQQEMVSQNSGKYMTPED